MYTQSTRYTKQSPQSPKYTEWSFGVYKKYKKGILYYTISWNIRLVYYFLSTFDLSLTWVVTCTQNQYYSAEKIPNPVSLFPPFRIPSFSNGTQHSLPEIGNSSSNRRQWQWGSESQWVTGALERKSSVIFRLCIYTVSKYGTSGFLFDNSTLRYECDETFSDECEFAARAEGEWCNHTCQENVFSHEYRTKFYITRCENADFRTRSVRKTPFTHWEWYKIVLHLLITIIPIDPFTLLKHQHPALIHIGSTLLRIHIIHTIMHTYKSKNVVLKHI